MRKFFALSALYLGTLYSCHGLLSKIVFNQTLKPLYDENGIEIPMNDPRLFPMNDRRVSNHEMYETRLSNTLDEDNDRSRLMLDEIEDMVNTALNIDFDNLLTIENKNIIEDNMFSKMEELKEGHKKQQAQNTTLEQRPFKPGEMILWCIGEACYVFTHDPIEQIHIKKGEIIDRSIDLLKTLFNLRSEDIKKAKKLMREKMHTLGELVKEFKAEIAKKIKAEKREREMNEEEKQSLEVLRNNVTLLKNRIFSLEITIDNIRSDIKLVQTFYHLIEDINSYIMLSPSSYKMSYIIRDIFLRAIKIITNNVIDKNRDRSNIFDYLSRNK